MSGLNNDTVGLYSGSPGLNEGTLGLYSGSPGLIHEGGGSTPPVGDVGSPIGLLFLLTKAS
jgi:hypothetical protein